MANVIPTNNDNDNSNADDLTLASLSISDNTNINVSITTTIASSLPFPKDGIRLSSIKDFYDACGGKDNLKGLTTTDVNEKYQKPLTANSGLSYCEYLKQQNSTTVGQAVVFISHGTTTTITITISTNKNTNINIITTILSMEMPILRCYQCS